MTTFAQAVNAEETTTTNGALAYKSTLNKCVDLFFNIGAMRGQDPIPAFAAAFVEDSDVAVRIMQWVRDVRGGAGERELFKQVLTYLENQDSGLAQKLMVKIPEIGRWDDLLVVKHPILRQYAFGMIKAGLEAGNGLCAKWMPRKGKEAEELRAFLDFSPKRYRKTLVTLTKVVETQMCAKDWDNINFSHVPSLAAARYKKAFKRNAEASYSKYAEALASGETKVNAGAVFPYDVLKGAFNAYERQALDADVRKVMLAQWDALPNYVGDSSMLAMVDVSGSMTSSMVHGTKLNCMEIAMSLGLYLAEKNTGAFKDTFLTFTGKPELFNLQGDVLQKMDQMGRQVAYNTNIDAAFQKVLDVAVQQNVAPEHMPENILILSDMQFDDHSIQGKSVSAMTMVRAKYAAAGYTAPNIVFWNLNAHGGSPTRFDESGVALVSGFSPAVLKAILACEDFSPMSVMLAAVMVPRYDLA